MASGRGRRALRRLSEPTTAVLENRIDVSTWDEEELIRGRPRDKNGHFRGRPPTLLPRELYDELRRRTLTEYEEHVRQALIPAIKALREIAEGNADPDTAAVQVRAIQEILNRAVGKPKERVEISHEIKPWERTVARVRSRTDPDPLPTGEIVDVTAVDPDDEPFED